MEVKAQLIRVGKRDFRLAKKPGPKPKEGSKKKGKSSGKPTVKGIHRLKTEVSLGARAYNYRTPTYL